MNFTRSCVCMYMCVSVSICSNWGQYSDIHISRRSFCDIFKQERVQSLHFLFPCVLIFFFYYSSFLSQQTTNYSVYKIQVYSMITFINIIPLLNNWMVTITKTTTKKCMHNNISMFIYVLLTMQTWNIQ